MIQNVKCIYHTYIVAYMIQNVKCIYHTYIVAYMIQNVKHIKYIRLYGAPGQGGKTPNFLEPQPEQKRVI